MGLEASLRRSEEPVTRPYSEPDNFSPHPQSCFFKIHFNIADLSTHTLIIGRVLIFTTGTVAHFQAVRPPLVRCQRRLTLTFRIWRPSEDTGCRGDRDRFNMARGLTELNSTVTPSIYAIVRSLPQYTQ
jgi:hypothetical protein